MRAVWSFWSKPFYAYYGHIWCKPLHHLLAWGLSLHRARRHYPETLLITDRRGKKLLVDQLGLSFGEISTEMERLDSADPGWWALGKLLAYSIQDRPFIHIDSDVLLWKPIPRHVADSPVFTQYPEYFHDNDGHYRPSEIEGAFARNSLELPIEWQWARSNRSYFTAENCGILGGSHTKFLRYYAESALDVVLRPENARAWSQLPDKRPYSMVVEQFFLSACVGFHRFHPASPYRGVRVQHLFSSYDEALNINCAARLGFTHLIGGTKSHPGVGWRLEERMRREDPPYFRRCERVLAGIG
jgi:hypothetical protein